MCLQRSRAHRGLQQLFVASARVYIPWSLIDALRGRTLTRACASDFTSYLTYGLDFVTHGRPIKRGRVAQRDIAQRLVYAQRGLGIGPFWQAPLGRVPSSGRAPLGRAHLCRAPLGQGASLATTKTTTVTTRCLHWTLPSQNSCWPCAKAGSRALVCCLPCLRGTCSFHF